MSGRNLGLFGASAKRVEADGTRRPVHLGDWFVKVGDWAIPIRIDPAVPKHEVRAETPYGTVKITLHDG